MSAQVYLRRAVANDKGCNMSEGLRKARIYHTDGRIERYNDQKLAFAVWLGLPKGVRAAFRGANDNRPVYSWDYVDV